MAQGRFYMTPTALNTIRKVGRDTAREWGKAQANKYHTELRKGCQECADSYKSFPAREDYVGAVNLSLHHVGHHYIAFRPIGDNEVTIAGVLYEGVDIPNRLKELQSMTQQEIAVITASTKKEDLGGSIQ